MRAPLTRLPDWFPLAVLGALWLIASGVAGVLVGSRTPLCGPTIGS